jgi:phage-related holin
METLKKLVFGQHYLGLGAIVTTFVIPIVAFMSDKIGKKNALLLKVFQLLDTYYFGFIYTR